MSVNRDLRNNLRTNHLARPRFDKKDRLLDMRICFFQCHAGGSHGLDAHLGTDEFTDPNDEQLPVA